MTLVRCFCFCVLLILSDVAASKDARGEQAAADSVDAIAGLAKQFDKHALIMLGEQHRNAQQHVFLRKLVRDPAFICRANDIVIEFGNARLQHVADAYVAGETVTEAQMQSMWRETEVMFAWNSPVYREFYETVRDINEKRICPHPIRLLLGDPPVDWSLIKTVDDFKKLEDRDVFFAGVVEREVLAKNRRALLISGSLHALRQVPKEEGTGFEGPNVVQIIERKHPGTLLTVATVPSEAAAETMKMGAPPSFRVVRGTDLENADFGMIAPAWTATPVFVNGKHEWKLDPAKQWPRMGKVVDGVLYLGGDDTKLFPSPEIYLEPMYQQQLRHRAAIIKEYNGQDFMPVLDDLIKEAHAAKPERLPGG